MTYLNYKKLYIFLLCIVFFPFITNAAVIRLESSKAEVREGEQFVINVVMFSDEPVNAIEGRLIFPQDAFSVKEIRDGNSMVNFWVEKPRVESPGNILFSGITPGGAKGVNNHIVSIVFEAKKAGISSFVLQNMKVLKNDGSGTEVAVTNRDVSVFVKPGDGRIYKEVSTDVDPPEEFDLSIQNNPEVFEGNNFIVFSTQDKGSGIDLYKVKEYRIKMFSFLSFWRDADSPYLLRDQGLKSTIEVKALDNAGNVRLSSMGPAYGLVWYEYLLYWGTIIISLYILFLLGKKLAKYAKI
jgi:hypothetical protein